MEWEEDYTCRRHAARGGRERGREDGLEEEEEERNTVRERDRGSEREIQCNNKRIKQDRSLSNE